MKKIKIIALIITALTSLIAKTTRPQVKTMTKNTTVLN